MLTHHAHKLTSHLAHPFPTFPHLQLLTQLSDLKTVIPRNSVIEANQSGLIAEPLLDVTPQLPLPQWSVGPNHPECDQEGAIVCENGRCVGGARGVMLMQWWAWAWDFNDLAGGQQDATVCQHVTRAGR